MGVNGCGSTNAEPGAKRSAATGSALDTVNSRARRSCLFVAFNADPVAALPVLHLTYFLKSFANASRAPVGGPDDVWRSTTIRVANSSQVLRACLSTIRAGIVLLHSRRAPGSK